MNSFLLAEGATTIDISTALTTATSVLSSAWDFISANPILFGACALGLFAMAIFKVKALF